MSFLRCFEQAASTVSPGVPGSQRCRMMPRHCPSVVGYRTASYFVGDKVFRCAVSDDQNVRTIQLVQIGQNPIEPDFHRSCETNRSWRSSDGFAVQPTCH